MKSAALLLSAGLLAGLATAPALASENWPNKSVRVIVPSSPGGGTDLYARLLTQQLSDILGQPFVVDNRPGASGVIGADATARAPADGYTILVASNSSITISPGLYDNLPFNAATDFTPIAQGVIAPMVLAVNAKEPYQDLGQLIQAGKDRPNELFYGSAGVASSPYLGIRMLEENTGAQFNHVPYKGVGPGLQDLLGGRLQFMLPDLAAARGFIEDGRLRALAVNYPSELLPGVKTFEELGVKNMDAVTSFSVLGPAGLPPAIVEKLSKAVNQAMRNPAMAEQLKERILVPVFDTPAEYADALKAERELWAAFIKRNNITPDQ